LVQVKIPHHSWYEDEPVSLSFPEDWSVHLCKVASQEASAMKSEAIKAAINKPVGQKPLSKLAEKAEEVVIIF
jgi:nickel-dependent lactate racemase